MGTLKITPHVMSINGGIIAIKNIAEADLWEDKSAQKKAIAMCLGGIASIGVSILYWTPFINISPAVPFVALMVGGGLIACGIELFKPIYTLILQTTAGRLKPLASKDKDLLEKILDQLHKAISHENPSQNYIVDISNSIINSDVGGDVKINQTRGERNGR